MWILSWSSETSESKKTWNEERRGGYQIQLKLLCQKGAVLAALTIHAGQRGFHNLRQNPLNLTPDLRCLHISFFTAHALYLTLHDSKYLARAFPFIELSHAIPRLPYNFSDTPKCYVSVMLKNMGSSMNVRRSYRVLSTCIQPASTWFSGSLDPFPRLQMDICLFIKLGSIATYHKRGGIGQMNMNR